MKIILQTSKTIVVGPWGGNGGNAWDDGSYTGVRSIEITHRDTIGSFSVVYDLNGKPFDGPKHISKHSFTTAKVSFFTTYFFIFIFR